MFRLAEHNLLLAEQKEKQRHTKGFSNYFLA